MSPQSAVVRLAEIVAPRESFTQDEVYAAMAADGLSAEEADLAFKFTQVAWGRAFLDGLGVHFSPDYLLCNGSGEVIGSGRLAENPYFAAALTVLPHYARTKGFIWLALTSSDVQAVNSALNAGSQPHDLVTGPAMMFVEAITPEGMKKASEHITERIKPSGGGGGGV
jgi:hypothetical protein